MTGIKPISADNFELEEGDAAIIIRRDDRAELVLPFPGDEDENISEAAYIAVCLAMALDDAEIMDVLAKKLVEESTGERDERS